MTSNVAPAASPTVLPAAVTLYVADATLATTNIPFSVLPVIEQIGGGPTATAVPVIVQGLSVVKNPDPVTVTVIPDGPEDG